MNVKPAITTASYEDHMLVVVPVSRQRNEFKCTWMTMSSELSLEATSEKHVPLKIRTLLWQRVVQDLYSKKHMFGIDTRNALERTAKAWSPPPETWNNWRPNPDCETTMDDELISTFKGPIKKKTDW